jgi:hypothetical protein
MLRSQSLHCLEFDDYLVFNEEVCVEHPYHFLTEVALIGACA